MNTKIKAKKLRATTFGIAKLRAITKWGAT